MKRFLSLALILGLALSLWGCGKEPAPTTTLAPTTVPPTTQAPCNHEYRDADCENPKTCTLCGITRGSALEHDYVEGICTRCAKEDKTYRPLVGTDWVIDCVSEDGKQLERVLLRFMEDGTALFSAGIYDRLSDVPEDQRDDYINNEDNWYDYSGVIYYYAGFGVMDGLTYSFDGNTITCILERDPSLQLILERIGGNMLQVTYFDDGFSIMYLLIDDVLSARS
jgi:hypothetical protein